MYDRENYLKTTFNDTIADLLGIEKQDFYSKLSTSQILNLKTALANINNIITLRMTFSLASWVCETFKISEVERTRIFETIRSLQPNSNGYDIEINNPHILAEVKGNIPINKGQKFGSNQKQGLQKDIEGLLNGKGRFEHKLESYKIIGLYDALVVREAMTHFFKNLTSELKQKIVIEPDKDTQLDCAHIYIVFVK